MKTSILCLFFIIPLSVFSQKSEKSWLRPDHYKAQFAGNIGFLSLGTGYLHGNGNMETDLFFGYLPKRIGGDHILILSLKSTYYPWKIDIKNDYQLQPFGIGLYLSYSFGSQFDTILPDEYPDGYYWWASSLRVGGYMGGAVTKVLNPQGLVKNISIYYTLGTYDLVLLSYIQNTETLNIDEIFNLAIGVRVSL